MNESFVYTESVRRRAQKLKALAEGEEEQKRLAGAAPTKKGSPAALQPTRRGAAPPTTSSVRAVKRTPPGPGPSARSGAKAAGRGPPATSRTVSPLPSAPSNRQKPSRTGGIVMPGSATPSKVRSSPGTNTRQARTNTGRVPAVKPTTLKASEERLLLESKELDLFETGQSMKVSVCPECAHELVKVVCLGTPVRVCLECKGTWFPYPVLREFARDNEWFQQLTPAVQLELDKHRTSR